MAPWTGGSPAWLQSLMRPLRAARRPDLRPLVSHPLGRGMVLHAVRWGDQELLLGCTEHGIRVLARRPAAQEPD